VLIDLLINTLFDPPMGELKLILGIVGCAPRRASADCARGRLPRVPADACACACSAQLVLLMGLALMVFLLMARTRLFRAGEVRAPPPPPCHCARPPQLDRRARR